MIADDPKTIVAPWSSAVVTALNRYQRLGRYHPYSCGECRRDLEATPEGWVCLACGYTQSWAHLASVPIGQGA